MYCSFPYFPRLKPSFVILIAYNLLRYEGVNTMGDETNNTSEANKKTI